jgi:hypothetical protein
MPRHITGLFIRRFGGPAVSPRRSGTVRTRLSRRLIEGRYVKGSLSLLPFTDRAFDLVLSWNDFLSEHDFDYPFISGRCEENFIVSLGRRSAFI